MPYYRQMSTELPLACKKLVFFVTIRHRPNYWTKPNQPWLLDNESYIEGTFIGEIQGAQRASQPWRGTGN
jgi:hypothetical protein